MKQEFLEIFYKTVVPILATALSGLIAWALKEGIDFLKEKGKTNKLFNAGAVVLTHVTSAVNNVEGGLKAKYLEAAKDGVITKEEAEALKQEAIRISLLTLGDEGKKLLTDVLGIGAAAIPEFLAGQVEKAVAAIPSAPAEVAPVPTPFVPSLPGGLPPPL